ncbi:MAG: hypothetical protein ACTII7_09550 [Galactobacter sp.]
MTATLRIEDVPQQVIDLLNERANAHDQSLQDLLLTLVTREAMLHRTPLTRTQAHRIVRPTEVA